MGSSTSPGDDAYIDSLAAQARALLQSGNRAEALQLLQRMKGIDPSAPEVQELEQQAARPP